MKYPRTYHLPQSPGGTNDDKRLGSLESFVGRPLVITEKLDGSNVCLEQTSCFARSHSGPPKHPSFDAFKAFHASVQSRIGPEVQVFGEWLYARHSIGYDALPHYLAVFGVRYLDSWASWEEVQMWASELSAPTVPVLLEGSWSTSKALDEAIQELSSGDSKCGGEREGFVVRWASSFSNDEFSQAVAKYVRKDHVQTEDHWAHQTIVRNQVV